jgi:hypothetical protein
MKYSPIILLLCVCTFSHSEELNSATKQEVEHLFIYLHGSGCEFNRNGTWYNAADAVNHIRKKYDYLVEKAILTSTESFIEKAASESSMSGKPYQVKCADKEAVTSASWFNAELKKYRSNTHH